jgi:hypothetical protein
MLALFSPIGKQNVQQQPKCFKQAFGYNLTDVKGQTQIQQYLGPMPIFWKAPPSFQMTTPSLQTSSQWLSPKNIKSNQ